MKASNILSRAWDIVTNGTDRQQLTVIYGFLVVVTACLLIMLNIEVSSDSPSYFDAGAAFVTGKIDALRTPVYPLLCYFAQTVSSLHCLDVIVFIQIVVFYISTYFMYKLCRLLISRRGVAFIVALAYVVSPNIVCWTMSILTESLAISLLVIFCYTIVVGYKTGEKRYSAYSFLLLVVLLFLRPIFVFLLPIVGLLWVLVLIRRYRSVAAWLNLLSVVVSSMLFLGYCKAFEKEYGFFAVSSVSDINQYWILRQVEMVDPSVITDPQMKQDVQYYANSDKDALYAFTEHAVIVNNYGYKAFHDFVKANIKKHFAPYLSAQIERIFLINDNILGFNAIPKSYISAQILYLVRFGFIINILPFKALYFALLLLGISFGRIGFKRRKLPVLSLFLWAVVVANIFTAVVGAPSDYTRLIAPCIPMLLILLGQAFSMVTLRIRKDFDVQ